MRSWPLLLVLVIIGIGGVIAYFAAENSDPSDEAKIFLTYMQQGDYRDALMQFGDNTCHCAPKGGYAAYLRYDMDNDPSLAFLMGQKFQVGQSSVKKLPYSGESYMMPWDKPQDTMAFIPITFDDPATQPYFLPLDMAFGFQMTESDLKAFTSDPSRGWMRAFTLRLRPKLISGILEKMPKPKQDEADIAVIKQDNNILPPELAKYQQVADAGTIKLADGKVVDAQSVASTLPRLKQITLGFKIVRAGVYHRWAIHKLGVAYPTIIVNGKEIKPEQPQAAPVGGVEDKE